MKYFLMIVFLFPLLSGNEPSRQVYEFSNGLVFNGQKYEKKTFYSVDGIFQSQKPRHIDRTIDLTGKYVLPPFGEAHNHNVADSSGIDELVHSYLTGGVFYVKNPNSLPRLTAPLSGKINSPETIDVIFSNGGITGSGGHPLEIVERNIQRGIWTEKDGEGAFYFVIDSPADLEKKWGTILSGHPDFIKTYLLYSEEYETRKNDKSYRGWRGLDPMLLPAIVRRAHESKLRVSTHVESAADFHYALAAGVDEINHLPGFRPEKENPANYQHIDRYRISEEDAVLAAKQNVVVVTTVGDLLEVLDSIETGSPQTELADAVRELVKENLSILARHKVRVAIGSDKYSGTSLSEAIELSKLKIFDNATLLRMWCEVTPQAIFLNRKIGRIADGYEASFLVLSADPIQDFSNVKAIEMRVKEGHILSED